MEKEKELTGRARRKEAKLRHQPSSVLNIDEGEELVDCAKLVESRREELDAMLKVVKAPPPVRTALQRISRAKRRRAAAHDKRRLPASVGAEIAKKGETKRRRKHERQLVVDSCPAADRPEVDGIHRLSANRWFARRFHLIVQFGWRLPLAPTEKKLGLCMRIASGVYKDGVLLFDHSYCSVYYDGETVHPAEVKTESSKKSAELGAKFIAIGAGVEKWSKEEVQKLPFEVKIK